MTYPYPELLSTLKHTLDVSSYVNLLHYSNGLSVINRISSRSPYIELVRPHSETIYKDQILPLNYWYHVPIYRYTYCPFCENWYTAPLDTYTLWGWGAGADLVKIPYGQPNRDFKECAHFLGVHLFLHLHNTVPEGVYYSTGTGEVPFITPWFFADDLACFAVLSALPICRIIDTHFVPTYTAWCLSYFSVNPTEVLKRHYANEAQYSGDREFYPQTVGAPGSYYTNTTVYNEPLYDLAAWCARGQLGWLDHTQPDLPLRLGMNLILPALYTNIQGDRREYTYRNGIKGSM